MGVLRDGETCWRRAAASRVAVLVDAEAYYGALVAAWQRAERSILMVGWDFHSRTRLIRSADGRDEPSELAELLDTLARQRPALEVHILGWDFAMLYALERESLPLLRLGLATHGRIRFHLDDRHPIGASQHQKIVVVDDRVAFSGGLDITACRWDTPDHAPDDPRRHDPGFGRYGPFHDVQMAVEGEVAARLGDLVRERWRQAVGATLDPPDRAGDVWPPDLEPDFRDVAVGIARTAPDPEGGNPVREVEAQYEAAFRAAQRSIYVENQYFSATRLSRLVGERLSEPGGPEVVLVLPASSGGWLEEATMGVRRSRLLRELREADTEGRLRVLYPDVPGVRPAEFTLHSKVLIVDDALLRVGSANLSNRSMGFDSECDLTIEADGDAEVERRIRAVRDRLVAEHSGLPVDDVAARLADAPSLITGLDALRREEGRSLRDLTLSDDTGSWLDDVLSRADMLDPERPMPLEQWLREQPTSEEAEAAGSLARRLAAAAVAVAVLVAAVRGSETGAWLGPAQLEAVQEALRGPLALPVAVAIGFLLSVAAVPLTAVGLVYGVLLPPWTAVSALVIGASLSVPAGYWLGGYLWRETVRGIAGRELNRLTRRLAQGRPFEVALLRQASRASFGIVNLVAGASRIPFVPFLGGTLLGIVPGAVLLVGWTQLAWRLSTVPRGIAWLLGLAAGVLILGSWIRRRRARREVRSPDRSM